MKKNMLLINTCLLVALLFFSMSLNIQQNKDWPVPDKYNKMKNPYADEKDSDQIGRELYAVHCKSCHGTKGKGDGNKAASIDTPIGDFTDGSIAGQSDGSIYYKTVFGRDDMPSFEKKIADEEERWLLINYILSHDPPPEWIEKRWKIH